jgi:hypothetical protein
MRLGPVMKLFQVCCLLLMASRVCFPQEPTADEKAKMEKEFPIILEIESSYVSDTSGIDPRKLAEATAMGSGLPTFAVFKGTLSTYAAAPEREHHWQFGCWRRMRDVLKTRVPICILAYTVRVGCITENCWKSSHTMATAMSRFDT